MGTWININGPWAYNRKLDYGGLDITGSPDRGRLSIVLFDSSDASDLAKLELFGHPRTRTLVVAPEPGRPLLFSAWPTHAVEAHRGPRGSASRVLISANSFARTPPVAEQGAETDVPDARGLLPFHAGGGGDAAAPPRS